MLAEIIGFVLALCFFGLPLGIIGLFVLSIVDQHDATTVGRNRRSRSGDRNHVSWSTVRLIIADLILRKRDTSA